MIYFTWNFHKTNRPANRNSIPCHPPPDRIAISLFNSQYMHSMKTVPTHIRICGLFILLVFSLLILPGAAAEDSVYLTITQPSANETLFAEGRDFYVVGEFSNPTGVPVNICISLLNETGSLVRKITSTVNESGVTDENDVNMSRISDPYNMWGGILAPDLIENPLGYANAENKLLVTKTYYHGLIQGGVTKDMGTYFAPDASGHLQEISGILTAGKYQLVVEAVTASGIPVRIANASDGALYENQTLQLTFGLTNATFGAFNPAAAKQQLLTYAEEHNRRTYVDWFPGYFRLNDGGYEISERWQPNNAIEAVNYLPGTLIDTVQTACSTNTLYNVGSSSTFYQVELSAIMNSSNVDSNRTTFLYYDIGEPEITWRNASTGLFETRYGVMAPLPEVSSGAADARIHYTHADLSMQDGVLSDGSINIIALNNSSLDIRADDTPYEVTVAAGENVIFYGVTRPLASELEPAGTAQRYIPQDQIMTFTYANDTLGTFTFPGLINRTFADGYVNTKTNYEFGHLFNSSVTSGFPEGKWVFTVTGYTSTGAEAEQTHAVITLNVVPEHPSDVKTPAPMAAVLAGLALAAILSGRKFS